jgi:SSS family solute:Na+ symporter
MVSFSFIDIIIIIFFFVALIFIGLIPCFKKKNNSEEYLLSGRKVGLLLFIITNVSTWYGGILGVGEFTYQHGLLSWFTQGLPYYLFAFLFAFYLAPKIRDASLFTIPDKLEKEYGRKVGLAASILIFILVSPAPYLLMIGSLLQIIFNIDLIWGLLIASIVSSVYLIKGGYKSDLYTDVFQFLIMFSGFLIIVFISFNNVGDFQYLKRELPENHLIITGDASPLYIIVWFLIALWTFADPGFHQRCYAAKDGKTAKWGLIISIFFWFLFDFLTTTTGLFAKAVLPNIDKPVMAFPLYAEKVLSSGLKGIFYSALFATIISTSNSFLFISATTFGKDLILKVKKKGEIENVIFYTRIGIVVSALISVLLAMTIQSVISIWYLIGSFCIPGIILLIIGAYYQKLTIDSTTAFLEIIAGVFFSIVWYFLRDLLMNHFLYQVEPMIVGMVAATAIHFWGIVKKERAAKN